MDDICGFDSLGADEGVSQRRRKYVMRGAMVGAVLGQIAVFLFGRKWMVTRHLHNRGFSVGPKVSFTRLLAGSSTGAGLGAGIGYAASRVTENK